jgi:radical SAM-linked protein
MKMRLEITKGDEIRYISHLDYARSIERALRRANLPVAYSEGFNPHMKMAFASALSVGVASYAEYMDVELADGVKVTEAAAALANHLPRGITIKKAREITAKHKALMALVNLAVYRVFLSVGDGDKDMAADAIRRFNGANSVIFVKENPKGRREIDVKQYIEDDISQSITPSGLELIMTIKITPTGSVKPSEILQVLIDDCGLPADSKAALIDREGLFVSGSSGRLTPLEID